LLREKEKAVEEKGAVETHQSSCHRELAPALSSLVRPTGTSKSQGYVLP